MKIGCLVAVYHLMVVLIGGKDIDIIPLDL
jgi:hypothetical protein